MNSLKLLLLAVSMSAIHPVISSDMPIQAGTPLTQNEKFTDRWSLAPPCYIISVSATKDETEARRVAASLSSRGISSGYLWIPDYRSLSGNPYYCAYIGPFETVSACAAAVDKYKKDFAGIYGVLVANTEVRIEIRGVGNVTIQNKKYPNIPGIYPQGSVEILSNRFLHGMFPRELKIMKNEIFARHQYKFKTSAMAEYFSKQSWYVPKFAEVDHLFSNIEKTNVEYLVAREKVMTDSLTHHQRMLEQYTSQPESEPVVSEDYPDIETTEPDNSIFTVVEEQPKYPGGEEARIAFLQRNIRYPEEAKELGIQGKVFVTFVVETDGSLSDVRVLRGIGGGCDEEAIRVIRKMPRWIPGKQKGSYVRVQFNLPIKFTLQEQIQKPNP